MQSKIAILILLAIAESAKLPDFVTKCRKDDPNLNDCALKTTIKSWPQLVNGVRSIHLPPLDPLYIEHIRIDLEGNLIINTYKGNVHGLSDVSFKSIKVDLEKQSIDVIFTAPIVSLIAKYDINGKILLLPIKGAGQLNVTYVDGEFNYHLDYTLTKKEDLTYIEPANSKFSYKASRAHFRLSNLFNGNKALGDEMNKFLDENWEDVDKELGAKFGEALSDILTAIMSGITKKVPYDELFLE